MLARRISPQFEVDERWPELRLVTRRLSTGLPAGLAWLLANKALASRPLNESRRTAARISGPSTARWRRLAASGLEPRRQQGQDDPSADNQPRLRLHQCHRSQHHQAAVCLPLPPCPDAGDEEAAEEQHVTDGQHQEAGEHGGMHVDDRVRVRAARQQPVQFWLAASAI